MNPLGTLPSEEAVRKLVKGEPGSLGEVFRVTLIRSLIISVPFFFLDIEKWKIAVGAASASTLITLLVAYKVSQDPSIAKG